MDEGRKDRIRGWLITIAIILATLAAGFYLCSGGHWVYEEVDHGGSTAEKRLPGQQEVQP